MATSTHSQQLGGFDPHDPAGDAFRASVGQSLRCFLTERAAELDTISSQLRPLLELAVTFTAGGKRLRPAFCWWGQVAAGGAATDATAVLAAAASLDLLHVSALVHDDVMDGSDTRRGLPAVHRHFEQMHTDRGGRGSAETFGRAAAILLGDLLLVWSAQMVQSSGLDADALARGLPLLEVMRTEVTAGQFLDVLAQTAAGAPDTDAALEAASQVVEYKSARYTVQRPVQFGAAIAGADARLQDQLAQFGLPLGRAFQYRDDLLGIFGDESVTGKPAGDDLREGKRTVVVAHALAAASAAGARELDRLLGDPDLTSAQIDRGRQIIDESGARALVERTIEDGLSQALLALDGSDITDEGRVALTALAHAAVERQS